MKSLPRFFWAAGLTVFASLHAAPVVLDESQWFDWPYREPVSGSALDLSELNHKPAGRFGRIQVEGHTFVNEAGERVRFWGCNVSAAECFPDAESAVRLARRLAKGGINIVRIHHVDNPWAHESGGSLWKPGDPRRLDVDPTQLDILHRFIAELKKEGVYVNINLKVSRTHTEADGFPASIAQTPAFQKRLDYFEPRIVDLQKRYALQLLGTKNPYTGLSLAEDPAVAMVEINNENALTGLRTREAGAYLEKQLPEPFRSQLTQRWNDWLARQFPSRQALAERWSASATPVGGNALPASGRWLLDAQPGNRGEVLSENVSTLHLRTLGGDGVRWRTGAYLGNLAVEENKTYTLTFSARASADRVMMLSLGRDEPLWRTDKWRTLGLQTVLNLTPEWQSFRFVFNTHSIVEAGARLAVMAGNVEGDLWLRDVKLETGSPTAGLSTGQDPQLGNVPIPNDPTPQQWRDWLTFLVDVEVAYVAEMRSYLQQELGIKVPIVNTQSNYGGIAGLVREQASDFTDTHCYWQHPDFGGPAGVWNTAHYTINQSPQLDEFLPRWFGELGGIAQLRVTGKPFTVTEVDTPAPSDYACELYPVLATFAGFQDWDGLFTFDMVGLGAAENTGGLLSFFDQHNHPSKWSFSPFAAHTFRRGWIAPATSRRELQVRGPLWEDAHHLDVLWLRTQPEIDLGFLTDRLEVAPQLLPSDQPSRVIREGKPTPPSVRLIDGPRGKVYTASSPFAATVVGHLGGGKTQTDGIQVDAGRFGRNFAAITLVSLDAQPIASGARSLVTLAARSENTGQKWNEARTSTMADWGHGPTRTERVPAQISVAVDGPRKVYALLVDGSRGAEVPATYRDGWLVFDTRTAPPSPHFEIVR